MYRGKNTGANTLNLGGLKFDGVSFTFTNGTLLAPGTFFVLARNAAAFASKYPGVTLNGLYSGRLNNNREQIKLLHPIGATVLAVTYDDAPPWPATAAAHGFSLVPKNPAASQAPDDGSAWRANTNPGGSPGADDPAPNIPPVVINEVLTASVPHDVDHIELFNPTAAPVDIGGWFLSDAASRPKKFRIADGTTIPAGGLVVFDETQFDATPGTNDSFSLSSHGESLYLFSGDAGTNLTGYSHGLSFEAADAGVPFDRHLHSVDEEHFPAQTATTFNAANAGPRIGPVVINEIHYNPSAGGDEFIELVNLTGASVPLYDPAFPTNTWRVDDLDFTFPANLVLPSNAYLLIVATNPVSFRAKYSISAGVMILGPYAGGLQDSGERLKLQRHAPPDTDGPAFITVDEVRYNDKAPWPAAADGLGLSLQRRVSASYGDDPVNWEAAGPTPGQSLASSDFDGDGLPDAWELANGTDRLVPDASADPDQDGATNFQEFLAGTDPQSAQSYLKIEASIASAGAVRLQFNALANRSYTVLYKTSLDAPAWLKLQDIPATTDDRTITIDDVPASPASRFYRIVTPLQP